MRVVLRFLLRISLPRLELQLMHMARRFPILLDEPSIDLGTM